MTRVGSTLVMLTVVATFFRSAQSCQLNLASKCPHYSLINQLGLIPIPNPDDLDTICSHVQESLQCLLNPTMLGKCNIAIRTTYNSILNVIRYPCQRLRPDYLAGRQCWRSSELKSMMKICYMTHAKDIKADFCSGQREFINCTTTSILTVPGCAEREQRVLTAMVLRNYNDNGLVMRPPCPELTPTSKSRTTKATTTATATTTTTTTATNTSAITTTATATANTTATMLLPSLETTPKESTSPSSFKETTRGSLPESTPKPGKYSGGTQATSSAGENVLPDFVLIGMIVSMSVRVSVM